MTANRTFNAVEDRQIREWIRFACECNQVIELSQVIVVEWNRRFTRRLGDGGYNPVNHRARIRLSTPLWPRAPDQDRKETVLHEACHIIVGFKHGYVAAHGAEWREAMKNCEVPPLRTHSVVAKGS